jgi:hypothetical protein
MQLEAELGAIEDWDAHRWDLDQELLCLMVSQILVVALPQLDICLPVAQEY